MLNNSQTILDLRIPPSKFNLKIKSADNVEYYTHYSDEELIFRL